jgi:hypothetical protein
MGSSLHQSATFKIITEWDQGKLSLLKPCISLKKTRLMQRFFIEIKNGVVIGFPSQLLQGLELAIPA